MDGDMARVLLRDDAIKRRVRELAAQIGTLYENEPSGLTIVPILSGSIIFLADLIREIPMPRIRIALVQVSSYRDQTAPGEAHTLINLTGDIRGRHVLVVDDILDSGGTLRRVQALLREHEPASIRTVVLLRKPSKAPTDVRSDFVGFDIDDLFVVGYGLDYAGLYRNYPHIGVLRPEHMK